MEGSGEDRAAAAPGKSAAGANASRKGRSPKGGSRSRHDGGPAPENAAARSVDGAPAAGRSADDGLGAAPDGKAGRCDGKRGGAGRPAQAKHRRPAKGGKSTQRTGPVKRARRKPPSAYDGESDVYSALDLGTNNCRLLVARPSRRGFFVVDAFSRIIRLGEGVSATGRLSEEAMERTIDALRVCAAKMVRNQVVRSHLVATEACRVAENGDEFLRRVRKEVGLKIEILTREHEAKLAVAGCASLIDADAELALVFDIGGGSSELIWLDLTKRKQVWQRSLADRLEAQNCIAAWTSLPVGVVTLAEKFGGRFVDAAVFEAMVVHVMDLLAPFEREHKLSRHVEKSRTHLLGTSGTVTTVAGIHLGLPRYDRNRVDGCWLQVAEVRDVTNALLSNSYEERVAEPCIGHDRADLIMAGCAILEGLLRMWPCERLRVADRGLREGMLAHLMAQDGVYRASRTRRGPRRR